MWDNRGDILQYICNNKKWFWKDLLFIIDIGPFYHCNIGPALKQKEVFALPVVIGAEIKKDKPEELVITRKRKRIILI